MEHSESGGVFCCRMRDGSVDISFVVVNYRADEHLRSCLRSLHKGVQDARHEVIVVDNSFPDPAAIVGGEKEVRSLACPRNRGYAAACNIGLAEARGRYVVFLNPDVRLASGSVGELLAWLDGNPAIGLVGPQILNPDGSRQLSCRSFPNLATTFFHRHSVMTGLLPSNPFSRAYLRTDLDGRPQQVDWASGCCLIARKAAVSSVAGFDEEYFLFFEDVDLALRLRQAGWKCIYYPHLAFVHFLGVSRESLPDKGIRAKYASAERYFARHVIRNGGLRTLFRLTIRARRQFALWRNALNLSATHRLEHLQRRFHD